MAWVKLDDSFADHPKVARVGAIGAWVQVQALCYCNRNLTDGFIPIGVAQSFYRRGVEHPRESALWTVGETSGMAGQDADEIDWGAVLVEARMWDEVEGGYVIHDYDQYQPSRARVEAERENKRRSGRAGAAARWQKDGRSYGGRHGENMADTMAEGVAKSWPVPVPVPVIPSLSPTPLSQNGPNPDPEPDEMEGEDEDGAARTRARGYDAKCPKCGHLAHPLEDRDCLVGCKLCLERNDWLRRQASH